MNTRAFGSIVVFGFLLAGMSAQAHHSTASVYDPSQESEVTGTLAAIKFVNPHGTMTITVTNDDGTTTDWVLTTGSANVLASVGFDKKTIQAGDLVTVDIYGSRDGKPLGFMRRITLADNRQFEFETK